MESKEQSLSKIVTALSGVNWGKDVEENHLKRIANVLEEVTKAECKSIIDIIAGGEDVPTQLAPVSEFPSDVPTGTIVAYGGNVFTPGLYKYNGLIWVRIDNQDIIPTPNPVDLGFNVYWADMNLGASSKTEVGNYYAWGETEYKKDYSWSTHIYCNGTDSTLTKYNDSAYYGVVDNKTRLDKEDDPARKYISGGRWRMPTQGEVQQLVNQGNWSATTVDGVRGMQVTKNSNSIFLPFSGSYSGTYAPRNPTEGMYWTANAYSGLCARAYYLKFTSNNKQSIYSDRCYGKVIRPVMDK